MQLNTYLNFNGNCPQAFQFYEKNLGGKINFQMKFSEMPDPSQAPPGQEDKILHMNMSLANTTISGADIPNAQPMRSAYLTLALDSNEETERIHKILSEGGEVLMPMQETFFAHRFSMLRDKFGILWMLIRQRPM